MKYNKLVRDNIPEIIKQKGGTATTRIARRDEYWFKLKEKLREEVDEFNKSENIEELADLLEVIDAIAEFEKIPKRKLKKIKDDKKRERGAFKKRIILEESQ